MRTHRGWARCIAVGLVGVLVAACASTDPGVTALRSRENREDGGSLIPQPDPEDPDNPQSTDPDNPDQPRTYEVVPGVVNFGPNKEPRSYDGFLTASLLDIQEFWAEEFAAVYGAPFTPLELGIFAGYEGRPIDYPLNCNKTGDYENDFLFNAFWCGFLDGSRDFMGYDDQNLFPTLVELLGQGSVAVVMAHEYGHKVQANAGVFQEDLPTIVTELQADCFAGAWVGRAARGESENIFFTDADVRAGMVAMLFVRDGAETDVLAANAHGTGFDRVSNFQYGFNNGASGCAELAASPLPLVDIDFTDVDISTQGNLPFDELRVSLGDDLQRFWTSVLSANNIDFTPPQIVEFTGGQAPTCGSVDGSVFEGNAAFCPDDNTIYVDADSLRQLYDTEVPALNGTFILGDMSYGYLLAQAYGDAVQTTLGTSNSGEQRALVNDCLAGAWVRDIVPQTPPNPDQLLTLSAGDLDEAVITAIARSDASSANGMGTAFDKLVQFRAGVVDGLSACGV